MVGKFMAKKITNTHCTFISDAAEVRDWARGLSLVKKISAGIIKPAKGARSPRAIKIKEEVGCLLLTIRGNTAIQDIRLYTEDFGALDRAVKSYASEHGFQIRR